MSLFILRNNIIIGLLLVGIFICATALFNFISYNLTSKKNKNLTADYKQIKWREQILNTENPNVKDIIRFLFI